MTVKAKTRVKKARLDKLFNHHASASAGIYMRVEPGVLKWVKAQAKRRKVMQAEVIRRVLRWAIEELGR